MKATELLFFGVLAWCGIGAVGLAISLARGRRAEAAKHAAWLAAVAGAYLLAVLGASLAQPRKVVSLGQDQCFDEMCFAVVGVDTVPSLTTGDDGRFIRLQIRVTNHGRSAEAEHLIEGYLLDSRGRVWPPLAGLSGNRLNAPVAGGSQILSQPIFRVAKDSAGLGFVLTHGSWQPGRLVIGDSDSLAHRPTVVALGD